jgi:hypothetical protein
VAGGRTYRSMEDAPIIVFSEECIRSLSDVEFSENRNNHTWCGGRTYRSMEDAPIIVFSEDYIRSLLDVEFSENLDSGRCSRTAYRAHKAS